MHYNLLEFISAEQQKNLPNGKCVESALTKHSCPDIKGPE